MDIIKEKTQLNDYHSAVFDMYFGDMTFAAFDIETTGLSPKNSNVILSGFCSCADGVCETVQFFAESLSEESELLEQTLNYISGFDFVLTYNGNRFDTPFTLQRARMAKADPGLIEHYPYDLDLYPLVRRFSDIGSFTPNLKQKTLENFMGLWDSRYDEIDGGESVRMYYDYLLSRNQDLKDKILLHNHDDVLQLYRLLNVTGRVGMHQAMNHLGFPVKTSHGVFTVESCSIKNNQLIIKGTQPAEAITYIDHGNGSCASEFRADGTFEIRVGLKKNDELLLCDLMELALHTEPFEKLASYGSGYLILHNDHGGFSKEHQPNCQEMNMLAQKLIEHIINYEL